MSFGITTLLLATAVGVDLIFNDRANIRHPQREGFRAERERNALEPAAVGGAAAAVWRMGNVMTIAREFPVGVAAEPLDRKARCAFQNAREVNPAQVVVQLQRLGLSKVASPEQNIHTFLQRAAQQLTLGRNSAVVRGFSNH